MPKPITYGDLTDQIGQPFPRPILLCRVCGDTFSASAGDYWDNPKSEAILCGPCDEPLELVRRVVTFEPVS